MSATAQQATVRVVVAADRSAAELIIPAGMNRSVLTPQMCELLVQQAGVELTAAVREAAAQVLAGDRPAGQQVRRVIARAAPPIHGEDGYVEWTVEPSPETTDTASVDGGDDARESYYDISAYVMVEAGQVLGRLHAPTDGRDGRDVTGKTLAARHGKECRLKLDDTIECDATGRLIARGSGVLTRTDSAAFIRNVLEVPEYVDFSTGNIKFHGDVIVSKGVRDLFIVEATGNVEVGGLIEAATIITGKDLRAKGGFAGRERGAARCGGDFHAKYIDNIHAEVAHDLTVDREIINCELIVHGNVAAPHGAIIGGRVVVTGRLEVGMLGSGANVPTQIVVGSVPRLEPLYDRLAAFIDNLDTQHEELLGRQTQLANLTGGRSTASADQDRQAIDTSIERVQRLLGKARPVLTNLQQRIESQRTIDVAVERKLFPGVILVVGEDRYQVNTDVKGPLRLCRDETGALIFTRPDGAGGLLIQIADVVTADDDED